MGSNLFFKSFPNPNDIDSPNNFDITHKNRGQYIPVQLKPIANS